MTNEWTKIKSWLNYLWKWLIMTIFKLYYFGVFEPLKSELENAIIHSWNPIGLYYSALLVLLHWIRWHHSESSRMNQFVTDFYWSTQPFWCIVNVWMLSMSSSNVTVVAFCCKRASRLLKASVVKCISFNDYN